MRCSRSSSVPRTSTKNSFTGPSAGSWPVTSPDAQMFTDLFRIVAEHGLSIPPEIAAVFRALAGAVYEILQKAGTAHTR